MVVSELLALSLLVIFAENIVLTQLLGVRPALDAAQKLGTALSTGLTVTVIMGLSGLCTWFVNTYLLIPLGLDGHLQLLSFILIIAALAGLLDTLLKKVSPALYALLGSQFPLSAINCAVLGVALQNTQSVYGALMSTAYGVFAGLGFTLTALLFACVCQRLEFVECPKAFEGFPIALVSAGLLAMAFMGFSGLRLG